MILEDQRSTLSSDSLGGVKSRRFSISKTNQPSDGVSSEWIDLRDIYRKPWFLSPNIEGFPLGFPIISHHQILGIKGYCTSSPSPFFSSQWGSKAIVPWNIHSHPQLPGVSQASPTNPRHLVGQDLWNRDRNLFQQWPPRNVHFMTLI